MTLILDTLAAPCLRCTRCGHRTPVAFPIAVTDLVTITRALADQHRACRPAHAADCWGTYRLDRHADRECDLCAARPACVHAARGL